MKDIIEDLDFLAEVLASLGGSDPYSGHTKSRPAIKVLDKCQRDLYRLEQMSKTIWCENDRGKARRKWTALKIELKKDETAQFHRVLEDEDDFDFGAHALQIKMVPTPTLIPVKGSAMSNTSL